MSNSSVSFSVARGSGWLLAGMLVTAAMQLLSAAFLGRILEPRDFGLITAATLVVRVVYYFSQFGLANAVVQKEDLTDLDVSISSALAVWVGLVATGVGVLTAPFVAAALGQPEAVGVARTLSVSFFLTGLGAVPLALLRRHLRFRLVAVIEVLSYFIGYLVVALIAAVVLHAGVWSLVAGALVQVTLQSIGGLLFARERLKIRFWAREAIGLVRFGGQVSVVGLLEFSCLQVDSVAVARGGAPTDLGHYNRASILAYPVVQVSQVLVRVLLPAFARIRQGARLSNAYLDALVVTSSVSFVTAALLAAGHRPLVLFVLGPQWGAAATVLPWLAAASAVQAVNQLPEAVREAHGLLRKKILLQSIVLVVFVTSIIPTVRGGAPLGAYAACWLLAELVRQGLYIRLIARHLGIPLSGQLGGYLQALVVAGPAYVCVAVVDRLSGAMRLSPAWTALAVVVTGITAAAVVLACWRGSRVRSVVRDRALLEILPRHRALQRLARVFN